jgi:hypothetical protein
VNAGASFPQTFNMPDTNFDEVLDLEEQFYDAGYQQGLTDGIKAGRIEGRKFGLEKGFEKYVESGRLHGKSVIWANRTPLPQRKAGVSNNDSTTFQDTSQESLTGMRLSLPQLPANARLEKHIKVLYALAESESLSTENTEDGVSDFDDRLKRAQAKAKIIERMAGEVKGEAEGSVKIMSGGEGSIEDALNARH